MDFVKSNSNPAVHTNSGYTVQYSDRHQAPNLVRKLKIVDGLGYCLIDQSTFLVTLVYSKKEPNFIKN
jgi:hypothetical protein